MRQHGRKSAASLAAAIERDERLALAKLEPPAYLGTRERAEWGGIGARFGSEGFPPEARTLLAALCAVIGSLTDVNAELSKFAGIPRDRGGWRKFRDLTGLRGQLATQVVMIGTKLRIMPQSRDV